MGHETGIKIRKKEWDVFVFGDANIDLIIPNVNHLPCAGQEELVDTMKTFVGGGAALFTLGLGRLGMHCAFQGVICTVNLYCRNLKKKISTPDL